MKSGNNSLCQSKPPRQSKMHDLSTCGKVHCSGHQSITMFAKIKSEVSYNL